jgi:uncharacterized protein
MHPLRRSEKEITSQPELLALLSQTRYVTIAMCADGEPYLVTLSHGYDPERHALYFHCARAGKKMTILQAHNRVWGQALLDLGYAAGHCDHHFASVHFQGTVTFVGDLSEKRHALDVMTRQLEPDPAAVLAAQATDSAVAQVAIGRIDIHYMSGKKSAGGAVG